MEQIIRALRQFNEERDWAQFHTPKNLAMALSVEAAEIVEVFQWMTEEQSTHLDEATRSRLADEIGDVLLYLANLSDKLGIDLLQAARNKIEVNARNYPADTVRGKADKYTEYRGQSVAEP